MCERGPLRPHWEGVTLLPNIQALLPMAHNRGRGWRVKGNRERESSLVRRTLNTCQKKKKDTKQTETLKKARMEGEDQAGKEIWWKIYFLCYVTSAVDGKMISPTRICSPSLHLAHCGNIASLNCELKAANIPNSWTFSTSMHPERLLMLHHSTSAFIFYFKHTSNKPNFGTQRGSAFYHTFQDHRNRRYFIFFSSISSRKCGPHHRFHHRLLTL